MNSALVCVIHPDCLIRSNIQLRVSDNLHPDHVTKTRGYPRASRGRKHLRNGRRKRKSHRFNEPLHIIIYFHITYKLQQQGHSQGLKWPNGQLRKRK